MKKEFLVKLTLSKEECYLIIAENMGQAIESVNSTIGIEDENYSVDDFEKSFIAKPSSIASIEDISKAIILRSKN